MVLGVAGFVFSAYHLTVTALNHERGYDVAWWIVQALVPLFFLGALASGWGFLLARRWGRWGLQVFAPLMLLYTFVYVMFAGEQVWWLRLTALIFLVFAAVSVVYAYKSEPSAAAT